MLITQQLCIAFFKHLKKEIASCGILFDTIIVLHLELTNTIEWLLLNTLHTCFSVHLVVLCVHYQ